MALDKQLADKLLNSRYMDYIRNLAQKNRYLHDTKDPDDLFQDMMINVWMKAVNTFQPAKTTYAQGDVERAFNAWVTTIAQQYLASLSAHHDTGKQEWERGVESADAPVKGKEGEDSRENVIDRLTKADEDADPEIKMDLQKLYKDLPEDLSWALQYIVENAEPGNISQIYQDIRKKYPNLTQTRLMNGLMENPVFKDLITAI